jgi:hypothetical protein
MRVTVRDIVTWGVRVFLEAPDWTFSPRG